MQGDRINVLGVGLSVLNLGSARQAFADAVRAKRKGYVCVTGVHGVIESYSDAQFRAVLNKSFLCTPDGMPMVWIGRLNGFKQMRRVYGPDLMLEIFDLSVINGYSHFFYGGANGAAQELKTRMEKRFPGIRIVGIYEPPFRALNPDEEKSLVEMVRQTKPDIMWIGLSTPKQEKFMAEYLPKLDTTLMVGVGAAFDFHSGRVKQAPRWIQQSGLEWFFRLYQEPKRLWKRYLKNNPLFLWRIFLQFTGLRKYPLE